MGLKITLLTILSFFVHLQGFSQTWIDKNENENYVERHECSFVQSGDTFIMFGGREQAQRLDIYDYTNNTWSQGAMAPVEFNHFQATEYDGLIWVIGAFQTNNFPFEVPAESVYMYNPALDYWIKGIDIPTAARRGGAGLVVKDDKFYVVAGNTMGHNGGFSKRFDEYDPVNNVWLKLADAPRERDHFATAIIGDKLYAASGRLSGGVGGTFAPLVKEVDVYDFTTESWSTLDSSLNIPTARAGASVVNYNDELFVMGGEIETMTSAYKTVEAFSPNTNSWSTEPDLNFARHGTQAIISGDGIFIAGGSPTRGGGNQHNMEVYNVDNPTGTAVVASTLNVNSNSLEFIGIETKDVMVTSSTGNAGNYITDVEISGVDAESFSIVADLKHHLIKSNTFQNLQLESLTADSGKTAIVTITYDNNQTLVVNLKTIEDPTLSVSDINAVVSFKVYPLPISNILKIKSEKEIVSAVVYDLSGSIVKSLFEKVNGDYMMNVQALSSGVYILKVTMLSGKIYYERIIKD